MQDSQIYEKLTIAFHDVFDDKNIILSPTTSAADIDAWDSFHHIDLIVAVEASLGVKFTSQELEMMESVGDIVVLIRKKLT